MKIKKIVSGAQTGADRAALDFAIEYGIEHGGWVPEGRMAEDGPVPSHYLVRELPGGDYVQRTEKNVEDSDGTLIVSRGELTGGSLLTWQMAEKHAKPCLHVNLGSVIVFDAAIDVYEWLTAHGIEVLNVAGPRASKDQGIYDVTCNILETVFHIDTIYGSMPGSAEKAGAGRSGSTGGSGLPQSVEQAVKILITELGAKTKSRIAGRTGKDIAEFENELVSYIVDRFGLERENRELLESCRNISQNNGIEGHEAASIIIGRLWDRLREIGQLRVVK
ncbi:MAG: putative molybdenum carrier protein [Desulfobacteraceae bacterium]|nr:putative molybdenum carrier protein [Desulfobacteraceae bacterium]MCF8095337.1 putative molybdenum carrier protein [Desulfobacteraceae bacterium]